MNKIALITGGTQGLGEAIAKKFAQNNYDLIITYLNSNKEATDLKKELEEQYSISVSLYHLNLESDEQIEKLFSQIQTLDVLINNAADCEDNHWNDKTREQFSHILNVNTVSPFIMAKQAYPFLKKSRGTIINISSTNSIDTMYTESLDYDASKAALNNLTINLSNAFAPEIRVNAILAGWIETHRTKDMNPKIKEYEKEKILLKRFAKPEEIANLVFFLASEEASYMTGSIIRIDGGIRHEL